MTEGNTQLGLQDWDPEGAQCAWFLQCSGVGVRQGPSQGEEHLVELETLGFLGRLAIPPCLPRKHVSNLRKIKKYPSERKT